MEPVTGKWVKAESQALNWSYKLKPGPNTDIPADTPAEAYFSLILDDNLKSGTYLLLKPISIITRLS